MPVPARHALNAGSRRQADHLRTQDRHQAPTHHHIRPLSLQDDDVAFRVFGRQTSSRRGNVPCHYPIRLLNIIRTKPCSVSFTVSVVKHHQEFPDAVGNIHQEHRRRFHMIGTGLQNQMRRRLRLAFLANNERLNGASRMTMALASVFGVPVLEVLPGWWTLAKTDE